MMHFLNRDFKEEVRLRFIESMNEIVKNRTMGCTTLKSFADAIGEHPQNISKIKSGERMPTIEQIARLCDHFEYSANWLLLGLGAHEYSEDVPVAITQLKKQIKNLEILVKDMSMQSKKRILAPTKIKY